MIVVALLVAWGQAIHAAVVGGLVMVQLLLMIRFLRSPIEQATWFSALGVTVYVSGMMVCAFALRGILP
jgi:chlorophyll synthase